MKTVFKTALIAAVFAAVTSVSQAQIVIRARLGRPADRVIVRRPPPPSPNHVWVDEDWTPRGHSYAWHGGYWAAPPRPHAVWVPGHWDRRRGGYIWIGGYWR